MATLKTENFHDLAGMPPGAYRGGFYDEDSIVGSIAGAKTFVSPGRLSKGLRTSDNRSSNGFNMRGVMEVLTEYGLNPTEELARILQETRIVTDRNGKAIMDDDGEPVREPIIGSDLRVKVLMDLQQFVSPKLKAMEVTIKAPDLSEEQIDARIAQLTAKAAING